MHLHPMLEFKSRLLIGSAASPDFLSMPELPQLLDDNQDIQLRAVRVLGLGIKRTSPSPTMLSTAKCHETVSYVVRLFSDESRIINIYK